MYNFQKQQAEGKVDQMNNFKVLPQKKMTGEW